MNDQSLPSLRTVPARSLMRTLALLMLLAWGEVARAENVFETINLPEGVSISMPRNWIILSDNQRITVQAFLEAATHSPERTSEYPFAANFYNDRGRTIALLNVRYYPKAEVSQENVRSWTAQEVREVDDILKANTTKGVVAAGFSVISWGGTGKVEINGITALISEYRRGDPDGPFRVRLVRVFAGPRSFTLTVSYLESAVFLEPVTDRIVESLRLTGFPQPVPTIAPEREARRVSANDYQPVGQYLSPTQRLWFSWAFGLVSPLLIRYVLLRRHLSRAGAFLLAGALWMFTLILFQILGFSGGSVPLITLATFWILRRGAKPPGESSETTPLPAAQPAPIAPIGVSESPRRYFVRTSTDTVGPFGVAELREMLQAGGVTLATPCRAVGDEGWTTVGAATAK